MTQILIYVGGILVLMLFGVMLTNKVISVEIKTGTIQTIPALVLVGDRGGHAGRALLFDVERAGLRRCRCRSRRRPQRSGRC